MEVFSYQDEDHGWIFRITKEEWCGLFKIKYPTPRNKAKEEALIMFASMIKERKENV